MSQKRNLPSWISSRDPETSPSNSHSKKPKDEDDKDRNVPSNNPEHGKKLAESSSNTTGFSKLMVCVPILKLYDFFYHVSFYGVKE